MRLAWLTDIHLNFVGQKEIEALCGTILSTGVDAVLLTGDIATSSMLTTHLKDLAQEIDRPIYFVLGNHDYYGSSIEKVKSEVSLVVNARPELVWLSQTCPVALTYNDVPSIVIEYLFTSFQFRRHIYDDLGDTPLRISQYLLGHAIQTVIEVSAKIPLLYIVLQAADNYLVPFYSRHGFSQPDKNKWMSMVITAA